MLLVRASPTMPAYMQDALQYVSTGRITDTTYPLEFAWFTGLSIKLLGSHGPEALLGLLYLLVVLSLWALARKCGAGARYSLFAALAAALYPQLVISVTKVWDVELSVLLMVLLALAIVSLMRDGLRFWLVLASGALLGLCLAQRPNMVLLTLLPVWVCLTALATWPRRILVLVSASALAALTLVAVNTLAHGSFFLSQNGPYNLVQGHNEYSVRVMLDDLTCEPSVAMIMQADGMNPAGFDEADPALQRYFRHRAFAFMRAHPLEEVEITLVKLWTVFRPNTRLHHGISLMTALLVLMSLIFPAWLVMLLRRMARFGLDRLDRIFIAMVVLYVLPFLITSSDPRYQMPIEICLLAHIAYMADPGRQPIPS